MTWNEEYGVETREHGYCVDYPACGHTDRDPCPGRGSVAMTGEEWSEANYCDICGYSHRGPCDFE